MTVEQLGKMSSRKMEDVDINTLVEVSCFPAPLTERK